MGALFLAQLDVLDALCDPERGDGFAFEVSFFFNCVYFPSGSTAFLSLSSSVFPSVFGLEVELVWTCEERHL